MLLPLLQNFNDARHMRSVQLPYAEAVLGLEKAKAVVFSGCLVGLGHNDDESDSDDDNMDENDDNGNGNDSNELQPEQSK